jgi:hypothetical protein
MRTPRPCRCWTALWQFGDVGGHQRHHLGVGEGTVAGLGVLEDVAAQGVVVAVEAVGAHPVAHVGEAAHRGDVDLLAEA